MLDIRYVPGIHIFLFALTLYYYSYFIISISLYLPFIPKHLIFTYLSYQHTYTLIQKTNILFPYLFTYYSITISFHHHSIHTPIFYSIHLLSYLSIPILYSLPTHLSLTILPYSIHNLHYHHSTTTQYIILYFPR